MTARKTNNYRFSTKFRRSSLIERFHLSYTKMPGPLDDNCWIWIGATTHKNKKWCYGTIKDNKKTWLSHRASWKLYHKECPDKLDICHRCDITLCVNPNHLFIETQKENNIDRDIKQRQAHGTGHGKYIHGKYVNQARWRTRLDGTRYYFNGNQTNTQQEEKAG